MARVREMIDIDGSYLEGGGQIVRTALALSALTGKPFVVHDIRKGRSDPGLKPQHLYAVRTLKDLAQADVEGDQLGSTFLRFIPTRFRPQNVSVDMETAGSITLFLQAVLFPLLFSGKAVSLQLTGGTDARWSMPIDYFTHVLVPQLKRYGRIDVLLERRGYYPAGGGKVELKVQPFFSANLRIPIQLLERGRLRSIEGISHASRDLMKQAVADRQAKAAKALLESLGVPIDIHVEYGDTHSTGSGITLWAQFAAPPSADEPASIILGSDALGERGKRAEAVGAEAAHQLIREIESGATVDSHLVDQIIPFMALSPPSRVKAGVITGHCRTNIYVVEKFLPVSFDIRGNVIECQEASKG